MTTYTDAQKEFLENVRVFAILNAQRVEVEVDTVAAGKVDVTGYFGQHWTHGGYAPITHLRVPIAELKELVKE